MNYIILAITIVFQFRTTYAIEREIEIRQFGIHTGWTSDVTTGIYTTASETQCALHVSVPGNSLFPLATYNKMTSSCQTVATVPPVILLFRTNDDKNAVLLDKSKCTHPVHVFKVYEDTDYRGNDYWPWSQVDTLEECVSFCGQVNVDFKAIMYQPSEGSCWCKKVTRQEHIDMGSAIYDQLGWNYYERLC